ncbi:MAG: VIT1/CCC1 transporter family protein [Hyphomicrobiaceae bacterium]|nr:VIT1/CCC1 transporter family protein [Hyphomicrobiaceae bacterium]
MPVTPFLEHSHDPKEIARRLREGPRISYLRDWVYGGIDGTVTTFAIVAGSIGADLASRYVLILGVANLLADGFSMAAANYSGTKAEVEEYSLVREMEERHIETEPEGEREEIRQIFIAKGFKGKTLKDAVDVITAEKERWIDTMMTEEHGLPRIARSPVTAGVFTFLAFVICGFLPVAPFAFDINAGLLTSTVMAAFTFFTIGSLRSHWSPVHWLRAGSETLAIGLASAGVAYLVGDFLKQIV